MPFPAHVKDSPAICCHRCPLPHSLRSSGNYNRPQKQMVSIKKAWMLSYPLPILLAMTTVQQTHYHYNNIPRNPVQYDFHRPPVQFDRLSGWHKSCITTTATKMPQLDTILHILPPFNSNRYNGNSHDNHLVTLHLFLWSYSNRLCWQTYSLKEMLWNAISKGGTAKSNETTALE